MSALPLKADTARRGRDVCSVPEPRYIRLSETQHEFNKPAWNRIRTGALGARRRMRGTGNVKNECSGYFCQ